jgi:hypothetical protein
MEEAKEGLKPRLSWARPGGVNTSSVLAGPGGGDMAPTELREAAECFGMAYTFLLPGFNVCSAFPGTLSVSQLTLTPSSHTVLSEAGRWPLDALESSFWSFFPPCLTGLTWTPWPFLNSLLTRRVPCVTGYGYCPRWDGWEECGINCLSTPSTMTC